MDDVTRRRQLEAIHARLHSLEALRREATERLLASEDAARIMGEVVASVAESIDAAGATLVVLSDENPICRRVYQRGMAEIPDAFNDLSKEEQQFWHSKFVRRQGVELVPSTDMPEPMLRRLEWLAIQALVGVPVFVERELWGFVILDENFEARQWQPEETGSLLAIAESMSMAIERDHTRTKLMQAKERAEMAVERLKELDQMKSEFLSMVSHELRTPLASITGFTTTMLEDPELDTETQSEFLGIIYRESTRLAHIIEDLLDFARIEQGAMKIEMVYTDLVALVRDVIDLMSRRFEEKHIALKVTFEQETFGVHLDPTRIGQVVKNLLSNALKFTEGGGEVSIRMEPLESSVKIWVVDNGVGIPEESLESVFERFYRVPSHTMMASGTGLGLPICKRIVELHHGQVFLESTPGKGTSIGFELPLDLQDTSVPVAVSRSHSAT
jgi:signal transduction histidine kinase